MGRDACNQFMKVIEAAQSYNGVLRGPHYVSLNWPDAVQGAKVVRSHIYIERCWDVVPHDLKDHESN